MVALSPCLHQLVEAQARRTPERAALRLEDRSLTYGQLERRAAQLARHLRARGAGADVLVGLCVERSLEMVVGILGILKAGAAYVPMDPAYPAERLAFMRSDAGLDLVLTQESLEAFDWNDAQGVAPSDAGVAPGDARVAPENLAYVIYTSGSTGRPKGVCIEHRNIVNYVLGVAQRLKLEPGMSYATVSTIAADLGNTVIFPALATGGCLHVISRERAESQAMLAEYFGQERIDVLKIVPSHLAALQSGRDPHQVMPRARLILGGEASRLDWIDSLRALSPRCEIHNHYGPTEATVGVLTYHASGPLPGTPSGTLPLGRPLPGSRIYLLDADGRTVAPGEKGELCIGGLGVARGYLNRPDLTAQKFAPDAYSAEAGARLYRTGDLARRLADGNIEFCGRIDDQVKLHGYRFELGEIEAALREHGGVQDAVVLARDDASGDKRVVAYVSPPGADPAALREYLKSRLPAYMVPAAVVRMERLPLTPNGKVDRQALALLPCENGEAAHAVVGPRTGTEKALAAIWASLLGVETVGIHDDLFDLGAHSLMAMKALTQMRDAFEVSLSLRNLFEHPTIAGLAEAIDGLAWLAKAGTPAQDAGGREELVL